MPNTLYLFTASESLVAFPFSFARVTDYYIQPVGAQITLHLKFSLIEDIMELQQMFGLVVSFSMSFSRVIFLLMIEISLSFIKRYFI